MEGKPRPKRCGVIRVGDSVAVFAEWPIGLCATVGAKLRGASLIVGIDADDERLGVARRFGANVTLNVTAVDVVAEIKKLTDGRGVDVAIEALGRQETFEQALRAIRPAARFRAWASMPGSSPHRTRRSTQGSATRKSSRRCVPEGRNECADS